MSRVTLIAKNLYGNRLKIARRGDGAIFIRRRIGKGKSATCSLDADSVVALTKWIEQTNPPSAAAPESEKQP